MRMLFVILILSCALFANGFNLRFPSFPFARNREIIVPQSVLLQTEQSRPVKMCLSSSFAANQKHAEMWSSSEISHPSSELVAKGVESENKKTGWFGSLSTAVKAMGRFVTSKLFGNQAQNHNSPTEAAMPHQTTTFYNQVQAPIQPQVNNKVHKKKGLHKTTKPSRNQTSANSDASKLKTKSSYQAWNESMSAALARSVHENKGTTIHWVAVSECMHQLGYEVNVKQCKNRWRKLQQKEKATQKKAQQTLDNVTAKTVHTPTTPANTEPPSVLLTRLKRSQPHTVEGNTTSSKKNKPHKTHHPKVQHKHVHNSTKPISNSAKSTKSTIYTNGTTSTKSTTTAKSTNITTSTNSTNGTTITKSTKKHRGAADVWTDEEMEQLRTLVTTNTHPVHGVDWKGISRTLHHTAKQCQNQWKHSEGRKKDLFTAEEDALILQRAQAWGDKGRGLLQSLSKELLRPVHVIARRRSQLRYIAMKSQE